MTLRDYAEALKRLSSHTDLAAAAQELPRAAPDDPDSYRYAAIYLAACVTLVASDASLSAAARHSMEEDYARAAVHLLRQAFERLLIADPRELDNPNFTPIRPRDDFQRLQNQMRQRSPQGTAVS
jgi:hypothetical protein